MRAMLRDAVRYRIGDPPQGFSGAVTGVRLTRGSDAADLPGRPVGGHGLADDPLAGHRAPEAAVVGVTAVVAHQEVVALGDRDRREVAGAAAARGREWLLLQLAVGHDMAGAQGDPVTGQADDALDEGGVGLLRGRPRARAARRRAAVIERAF